MKHYITLLIASIIIAMCWFLVVRFIFEFDQHDAFWSSLEILVVCMIVELIRPWFNERFSNKNNDLKTNKDQ